MTTMTEGVLFESEALGPERYDVRWLRGTDELNRLYELHARVVLPVTGLGDEELQKILDAPARLVFIESGVELNRYSGIVSELSATPDAEHEHVALDLTLVPRLWLLGQHRGSELYLGRSLPEVIADKLSACGFAAGRDFTIALREEYPVRELVAQHEETDLAFVLRLCEHAGITLFFQELEGAEVAVLTDQPELFRDVARAQLSVRHRREHPAAYDVRTTLRRVPREAQSHDYNYRTPLLGLRQAEQLRRPVAKGTWTEYGPHTKTVEETKRIAGMRAEEWAAQHHVVEASATETSLRAGGAVHLGDALGAVQHLVLTRVDLAFRDAEAGSDHSPAAERAGNGGAWNNRFRAIPATVRYRPPRVTSVPRVPGLLNAVVDGQIRGDYAELDDHGRYRLRMAFDRSGRTDLGATHPVRMMQSHAGASYGMHFPLRPGTEVLVGFVNADPDRPIIVGTAPNPVTPSPVVLANQTQNVLRTGSNNEMVIEDLKGIERIRLHCPHESTTIQLGAVDEPEDGLYMTTQAHVSSASGRSHNVMTDRHTTVAQTSAALLGKSALIVAGLPGVTTATEQGLDNPANLSMQKLQRDFNRLATHPAERGEAESAATPDDPAGGDASQDPGGGLASSLSDAAALGAESAALSLVRTASEITDHGLDNAMGRSQGEALGEPLDPSALVASERTAALIGRDVSLVFGDRTAALSSHDTASVMGQRVAQVKSPGTVEVAGAERVDLTSAGELDIAANTARIVAGYYPAAEAPPLDANVSLGVMSRRDLRVHSVEDCILVCAKKNLIGSAHTGDVRLTADKSVKLTGGSIIGSAGTISFDSETTKIKASGDIEIEAGGNVLVKAAGEVAIQAPTIRLAGDVLIEGKLFVTESSDL